MRLEKGWNHPDEDRFMAAELKEDGGYQSGHLRMALKYVTDWSLAVDAGCHIGSWAKPMSARFAKVVAFEPSQDTYQAFVENMRVFGCANVEGHNVALGAVPGRVTMTMDARAAQLRNTGARYVQPAVHGMPSIRQITLDSLNLPSCGFLKIDAEGSEPSIIEGAADTLKRCQPVVLYENKGFCRRFGYKPDAARTLLEGIGYRFLETAGCDLIFGPGGQVAR